MKRTLILVMVFSLLVGSAWARTTGYTPHRKLLRLSSRGEVKQRVIVRFRSKGAMERLARTIPSLLKKKYRRFSMMAVKLSGREAASLARDPGVLSIEPDSTLYLHDWPDYNALSRKLRKGRFYNITAGPDDSWGVTPTDEYEPYGLGLMGVTRTFHDQGYLGQGAKVGIIDTGIDTGHPDLHVTGGWNFYNDDMMFGDVLGHGTHVAGIIGARRNGYGVVGMAPEAEIYSLRAFDIFGHAPLSAILDCIQWAIDYKLQVLNMSFGMDQYSAALKDAVERAYEAGLVLVASAGNSGRGTDTVSYPAKYDTVIAVSAIDENREIADFSSRGPAVEVTAPGVDVLSTFTFPPHYEHFYDILSGTSMAGPHVTGMAALIISANPGISNEEVRRRLRAFAIDLGPSGGDSNYGAGLPQPERDASTPDQSSPVAAPGGPYHGVVGEPIRFSVEGTLDADDNLLSYEWDFGDGTTGAGRYPEHVYGTPGPYVATLTVRDRDGLEGEAEAEVVVGAGVVQDIELGAADTGYVKEPNSVYLGRKVLAGVSSRKRYYGVMEFDAPVGGDTLLLSAELVLTCTTRSPKDEGTITAGLLPQEIAEGWPSITYPDIDQATVVPLDSPIVMSYLHNQVKEGAEHRFRVRPEHLVAFEEQLQNGRVAFRMDLDTGLTSNLVSWSNPRLILRYVGYVSSGNMAPVAEAGYDRRVVAGSQVVLDGSGSYDPEGGDLTFTWTQMQGTEVELDSENSALATFTAPAVDDVLVFELEVGDGEHISTDQVTIYLNNAPADLHTVVLTPGFGKAGYVEDDHPELNFFDKRVIVSGVRSRWKTKETTTLYGQAIHVGAMQFDLSPIPPGSQIASATLELTGARRAPDRNTSYDVSILDALVDNQWSDLDYESLTGAEATAALDTLASYELGEEKVNRIRVPVALLETRRASTGKVTFRIDGPTRLMRNIWEWFIWWSGNEEATADEGPRLVVEYGALEPVEVPVPEPNRPPVPQIVRPTEPGEPGVAYDFTFSATDPDGDMLTLAVDWGDGRGEEVAEVPPGVGITLPHAWSSPGTYTVSLRATDEEGASASVQTTFQVELPSPPPPGPPENHPPVIESLSGPGNGIAGVAYTFDVSATDPDGDEVRFVVDWDDGTVDETGFQPSGTPVALLHKWLVEGTYTVSVTAEDTEGASVSSDLDVEIQAPVGEELVISDEPAGTWYLGSSNGRRRQAQTFKAIGSRIMAVSLALVRIGDPAEPIEVTIRRRSLTSPPLASAEVYPSEIASTDKNAPSWITVYFPEPAEVRDGSGYFLVLEVSRPDSSNYYRVGYAVDNPYPYGMWYLDTTARRDLDMACTVTFGD